MQRLNDEHYNVYKYIANYIETRGYNPLVTEMAHALQTTTIEIERLLWQLRYWGYIQYASPHSQMIYLTNRVPQAPSSDEEQATSRARVRSRSPRQQQSGFASSPRRQRIYTFIEAYLDDRGYPPALQEIAQGLNLSMGAVRYHVHKLQQHGYLTVQTGKSRSIRLTSKSLVNSKEPQPFVTHC